MIKQSSAGTIVTTPPVEKPITLKEVKEELFLSGNSSFDNQLRRYIDIAIDWAQTYTGLFLITQSVEYKLNHFPYYEHAGVLSAGFIGSYPQQGEGPPPIKMWPAPVQSVDQISYILKDNTTTVVLGASSYYLTAGGRIDGPAINLASGSVWPSQGLREQEAITITAVVGYGDTAADVPESIKEALRKFVAYLFTNRSTCDHGGKSSESIAQTCGAMALLRPYMRIVL